MDSVVGFVVSNPDTARLVLNYAWIVIPMLATLVTFLVRLCSCCIFGLRDNSSSLCCCGGGSSDVENARCAHIHHHHASSGEETSGHPKEAVRYDYVPPSGSEKRTGRYRYMQALICCFGFVCAVLVMMVFAALFPFLEHLSKQEAV